LDLGLEPSARKTANEEMRLARPRAQRQEKTKEEFFGMVRRELPSVRYAHVRIHRLMAWREVR